MNARPTFSKDGKKLYFGYAPEPILQDTSILDEEIVHVEVWHYEDSRMYTQQNVQLEQDKKRSFTCVWNVGGNKVVPVANSEMPDTRRGNEGNALYVLATNTEPHSKEFSWTGQYCRDLYLVNTQTGAAQMIAEKVCGRSNFSPDAKFVYWYSNPDTAWFAYDIQGKQTRQITNNKTTPFYDELDDHPDFPLFLWTSRLAGG